MKLFSFISIVLLFVCWLGCTTQPTNILSEEEELLLQEWNNEKERIIQEANLIENDFEKSVFIRNYCSSLADTGTPNPKSIDYFRNFTWDNVGVAKAYHIMKNDSFPVTCAPLCEFYSVLLDEVGIPSITYGHAINKHLSHVVTLLEIETEQGKQLILQDPLYVLTYTNLQGSPLRFDSLMYYIYHQEFDEFLIDTDTVTTQMIIDKEIAMKHISNPKCLEEAQTYFEGNDNKITKQSISRHYDYLFKNPCNNKQIVFEAALKDMELPQHYLYTLFLKVFYSGQYPNELSPKVDAILDQYPIIQLNSN